jgi:hypothetical protein
MTAFFQAVTCDKLVYFLQLKFQNVSAKGKGFNVTNESEAVPLAHKRTVPSQSNEGEQQVPTMFYQPKPHPPKKNVHYPKPQEIFNLKQVLRF